MPKPHKSKFSHGVTPLVENFVARVTEAAHRLVRERVGEGDRVVDATIGNGQDTVFLAGLVGRSGRVDGFDIQSEAIESTRQRLQGCPCDHVVLHQTSHEKMAGLVEPPLQAVMFNLGYLPGGDKQVVTRAETTTQSIRAALDLLSPTGIITIVAYPGHSGGREEADAVLALCQSLDGTRFSTTVQQASTPKPSAPFLVAVTPVGQAQSPETDG